MLYASGGSAPQQAIKVKMEAVSTAVVDVARVEHLDFEGRLREDARGNESRKENKQYQHTTAEHYKMALQFDICNTREDYLT